jgi:hypothetical protein
VKENNQARELNKGFSLMPLKQKTAKAVQSPTGDPGSTTPTQTLRKPLCPAKQKKSTARAQENHHLSPPAKLTGNLFFLFPFDLHSRGRAGRWLGSLRRAGLVL